MARVVSLVVLAIIPLGLSACGGGGGGGAAAPASVGPPSPPPVTTPATVSTLSSFPEAAAAVSTGTAPGTSTTVTPNTAQAATQTYETMASAAPTTSDLSGVGLAQNAASTSQAVVKGTGTLTHDTGALSVTANGTTYANRALTLTSFADPSRYDFVRSYDATNGATTATLIAGVATATQDVRADGTAAYTGDAQATVIVGSTGTTLSDGRAQVTVDFANSDVDVALDNFTARDFGGTLVATPVTDVFIDNMEITGNTFAGGTLTLLNNGASASVLGDDPVAAAAGSFFGYDASGGESVPDEVGGAFSASGNSGQIFGIFVGD